MAGYFAPRPSLTFRAIMLCALTFPFCVLAAEEKVLHVYNWVEYIGETTLQDFEAKTGIKVTYDVYDSNDVLQGKLLAGQSGFDVVVPSSGFLARLIGANVFLPLDHARLPNLKHTNPAMMQKLQLFDPGNKFALPYLWGTTGIGINRQLVTAALGADAPVDSWELVFNPAYMSKLTGCGVSILDAFDEIFPAVLTYKSMDPQSQDPKLFEEQIVPVLTAINPFVTYYHSSKYIDDLANGDLCVAVGWSGDILQAGRRAAEAKQPFDIEYFIPKEGTNLWFDMMAIPVDAPHPDNAHQFINFLMQPEVIAAVTNKVRYANGNHAADAFIDADVLANPNIYPPPEIDARNYLLPPYPQKVDRKGLRMWTRLKTGR